MIWLLSAFLWLLHWLPFRAVALLGKVLGSLLYRVAGRRRRVGATNLQLCFPHLSEIERAQLLRRHFQLMATAMLEYGYCWYAPAKRLRQLVRVEGMQHLDALKGQPVILFAGHFVGLEIGGLRLSADVPMMDLYTRQSNAGLDARLAAMRGRFGGRLVVRTEGVRPMIKGLREGLRLYYLPDQDYGPRDAEFLPFFGVKAATITGMSRLARVSGAAVVPCFVYRERDGYRLVLDAPLANFPSDDVVADALRMNTELEARIRQAPEQYFWLHKRFKTRPEGEARLYAD